MRTGSQPARARSQTDLQGLMGSCWKSMVQMGAYMAQRKKRRSGLQLVPSSPSNCSMASTALACVLWCRWFGILVMFQGSGLHSGMRTGSQAAARPAGARPSTSSPARASTGSPRHMPPPAPTACPRRAAPSGGAERRNLGAGGRLLRRRRPRCGGGGGGGGGGARPPTGPSAPPAGGRDGTGRDGALRSAGPAPLLPVRRGPAPPRSLAPNKGEPPGGARARGGEGAAALLRLKKGRRERFPPSREGERLLREGITDLAAKAFVSDPSSRR